MTPDLLIKLFDRISEAPIWATVNIQNVCKGNAEAQKAFNEILTAWSKSTVNQALASAAKSTLGSGVGH